MLHDTAPSGENVPTPQIAHTNEPESDAYVPSRHSAHAVPLGDADPGGHEIQPAGVGCWPASQRVTQWVRSALGNDEPEHATQLLAPADGAIVPVGHALHAVPPPGEKDPALHDSHCVPDDDT